jgi:hypothetical protein
MISYAIFRGHDLFMECKDPKHNKEIKCNQEELDHLMVNSVREISWHAVTVYADFLRRMPTQRVLSVEVYLREIPIRPRRILPTSTRSAGLPTHRRLIW